MPLIHRYRGGGAFPADKRLPYKGTDVTLQKQLLMDAIVLTIFTYGPVDRVGIIRKLRLNDTLAAWRRRLLLGRSDHQNRTGGNKPTKAVRYPDHFAAGAQK